MNQCAGRKRDIVARSMGAQLRACRTKRGVTQSRLAAKIGVSFQAIQKYESGQSLISVERVIDICRALNTTPNYLFRTPVVGFFEDLDEELVLGLSPDGRG